MEKKNFHLKTSLQTLPEKNSMMALARTAMQGRDGCTKTQTDGQTDKQCMQLFLA